MVDELMLLSGNDIPFVEGRLIIHPPTIKEIGYITEENFWYGCELLKFNKEILTEQDKKDLSDISNFNIIMNMMHQKTPQSQKARLQVASIFTIMFPLYKVIFEDDKIVFIHVQTQEQGEINEQNFEIFRDILIKMFCLETEEKQYDPSGELAKKIADQIKRSKQKKAKLAPHTKVSLFTRYVSILAAGQYKDINMLMNYTVYQLMDEYKRFNLKLQYDSWLKFKCAGATGMEDPEDWFKDIHEEKK